MPMAALNSAAGNDAPVPSMAYMAPNGNGALTMSSGPSSYLPMPGVDPTMQALLNAPSGPESPYARRLSDVSDKLLGNPEDLPGALEASRGSYDKAVRGKMDAINRAMARLSGLSSGQSNLPLMAGAAGALQPTRTGGIAETLGNAFSAAIPQIEKQRAVERQIAGSMDNLDVGLADTGIEGAQGDERFLDKRLDLADKYASQAGNVQNRADLNYNRLRQSVLQYAGRISTADIAANKDAYEWVQNDPNNPNAGVWRDKRLPPNDPRAVLQGPAQGAKPRAEPPPSITPNEAMGQARKDYDHWAKADIANGGTGTVYNLDGSVADPTHWITSQAQGYLTGKNKVPGAASAPAGASAPAPQPGQATPPAGFKKAPDGNYYAPDPKRPGKYVQWTP